MIVAAARTPGMLIELTEKFPGLAASLKNVRTALGLAQSGNVADLDVELEREEKTEREADRKYWEPLRRGLELLRSHGFEPEEGV